MLTQKYKQQQQQVRVQTSESNYAKGMFFSDAPLAEGYSKVLVNWDIDATTGKLTPRKGLRTIYAANSEPVHDYWPGYNLSNLKYVHTPEHENNSQRNKYIKERLLGVLYNPNNTNVNTGTPLKDNVLLLDMTADEYGAALKTTRLQGTVNGYPTRALPYTMFNPTIHGQKCVSNSMFSKVIGAYAFDNNYYTFLQTYRDITKADWRKIGELNESEYFQLFYLNAQGNDRLNTNHPLAYGVPGTYYTYTYYDNRNNSVDRYKYAGGVIYYREDGTAQGAAAQVGNAPFTHEACEKYFLENLDKETANQAVHTTYDKSILCYTKLGKNIQIDDVLLDASLNKNTLDPNKYYVCVIDPQKLNPTEAASWGYNMLLDDPYKFECEKTAANVITILGIIPYDSTNTVTLTPRKNQEVTLKAYYRAPDNYYTDVAKGTYYATAKQYIEVTTTAEDDTVTTEKRDPKTKDEIPTDFTEYKFGDWWYCTEEKQYYMLIPDTSLTTKILDEPSATKPAASVLLTPKMSATAKKTIRARWQIRTVDSSDWIDLYNETLTLEDQAGQPFVVTTTMSSAELLVKFTISDPASVTDALDEETVITTNTIGLSLVSDELANTLNLEPVKYDLGTCSGMCEWEQRLVLWGVQDALNTLFVSDVNNPTYFPYPNNIDTFPDPIKAVYPFGNELLVLTSTSLYRLAWDTEGTGWSHKVVQQNLNIAEEDIPMCCVIKNMFFFKSGNYYYMMVPKSSASGVAGENTSIAPISKPIEGLLDNFHDEIVALLSKIADVNDLEQFFKQNLCHYFVNKSDNKIILNYVYDYYTAAKQQLYKKHTSLTTKEILDSIKGISFSFLIYVQLIYDTDARTWSLRVFESRGSALYPVEHINLQQEHYAYVYESAYSKDYSEYAFSYCLSVCAFDNSLKVRNKDKSGIDYYDGAYLIDEYSILDRIHNRQSYDAWSSVPITLYESPEEYTITIDDADYVIKSLLNNYQFLDTGNRDINTDMKKRFREFQFKMRNVNATSLGFHTSFLIDGSLRRDLQKYTPRYLTDPETGEMVIVIERTLDEASINYLSFVPAYKVTRVEYAVASTKMLQDDGELTPTTLAEYNDPDKWVIDQSAFPGRTFWKVRVSISGKGYTPRAQLLSTNLKYFEVFGHSWVYRTMHGR